MATYWAQLLASRILYDSDRSGAAADDVDVTDWVKTAKFILATQIGYDNKDTAAAAYRLYWRNVTDAGSWTELSSSGEMKYSASSSVLTDDGTLGQSNSRITAASGMTWQDGLEDLNNRVPNSPSTYNLGDDYYTEFQWGIDPAGAHDGDEYEFKLYNITLGQDVAVCLCTLTILSTTKLKTYQIDMLLQKLGLVKTVDMDMLLASRLSKAFTMDMVLEEEQVPAGTRQVILGGYYDDLSTTATEYNVLQGGSTWGATESYVTVPWPTAGKFTNLRTECDSRLTAGSYTVTLRKNGAGTDLAVTMTSGALSGVDTDEVTVAAGDLICLQATPNSPTGTPFCCWGIDFIPDVAGETVMCGVIDRAASAATVYAPLMCGAPYNFDTSDNWAYYSLMPTAGTLKKLYARSTSTTSDSNYLDFTVYKSTAATDLSARCSSSNIPDTTDTVDIADADVMQVRVIQTGTVADGYCRWAAVFVPDTSGEFVFAGQSTDNPTASATEYNGLNGQFYSSVWDTNETRYMMKASSDFTAKKIRVGAAYSPGSGKSRTLTLRRASTSDTSLAVTLSDSEIADSYSTDVSITAGWNLNIKHTDSGTPTTSQLQWTVLGYITPTGAATLTKTYTMDALLQKQGITETYDMDMLLKKMLLEKTFQMDAYLAARTDKAYQMDAWLKKTLEKSLDMDALIADRLEKGWNMDLLLAKLTEKGFDMDMLLAVRNSETFDMDALLASRQSKTYDMDLRLLATLIKTYQMDMILNPAGAETYTKDYDMDMLLLALGLTKTFEMDMWLKGQNIKDYTMDMILKILGLEKNYTVDMLLAAGFTKTYQMDMILKALGVDITFDMDMWLKKLGLEKSYQMDMLLTTAAALIKTYTMDMLLKKLDLSKGYDMDTLLAKLTEKTFQMDLLLAARTDKAYTMDLWVQKQGLQIQYNMDMVIKLIGTKSFQMDLMLVARQAKSWDMDMILKYIGEKSYTMDMILTLMGMDKTYTMDMILKALGLTKTYSMDMKLAKTFVKTYQFDMLLSSAAPAPPSDWRYPVLDDFYCDCALVDGETVTVYVTVALDGGLYEPLDGEGGLFQCLDLTEGAMFDYLYQSDGSGLFAPQQGG